MTIALMVGFVFASHRLFGWGDILEEDPPLAAQLGVALAVLTVAVVTDFVVVTGLRATFGWADRMKFYQGVLLMIGNVGIVAVALWLPWYFGKGQVIFGASGVRTLAALVSLSNIYTALVASLFFVLTVVMMGHSLIWPTVSRVVYTAQRYGLIRRKKLLAVCGLALVGVALPALVNVLKAIVQLL